MNNDPILRVRRITFSYGKRLILDNLTFAMGRGATGLLGPNGAGKSTLLKILLGFLKPDRGGGTILGTRIDKHAAEIRRRIGYMPEHDCLIPSMQAVRLVTYCGELCGMPWREAMQRAHEVLFFVGLGDARYREVGTFSSGMRQRLKLAQALVHGPDILFLDEPTNGLDPMGRREMLELIRDIVNQGETSVVFSSHILYDVEAVCSDVIMIKKGRLVVSGKIDELKKIDRSVYEVRLKGDPDPCLELLVELGCRCERGRQNMVRVILPPDCDARLIFDAARETGVQIRHLMHRRDTLEDVFIGAIVETAQV